MRRIRLVAAIGAMMATMAVSAGPAMADVDFYDEQADLIEDLIDEREDLAKDIVDEREDLAEDIIGLDGVYYYWLLR